MSLTYISTGHSTKKLVHIYKVIIAFKKQKELLSVVAETFKSLTPLLLSLSSMYLAVGGLRRTPNKGYLRLGLVLLHFQI